MLPLAIGGLGPWEIVLILLVVLLVFGAKRIPEIARGLGKGIREFKDATTDITRELQDEPRRQVPPPARPPEYAAPRADSPAQHYAPPPQATQAPPSAATEPPPAG